MPRDLKNLKKRIESLEAFEHFSKQEALDLFSDLIFSGLAWSSGQMISAMAQGYVNNDLIDLNGNILQTERKEYDT